MRDKIYAMQEIEVPPSEPDERKLVQVHMVMTPRPIPGTGIPGFPETQKMMMFGVVDEPFQLKHIAIDPECVPYFRVHDCFIGANTSWEVNDDGVAAEILARKPDIKFRTAQPGIHITLQVRNVSDRPRVFKARLIGLEG